MCSKNFLLKHMILWLYCIDLLSRIPKSLYLLFFNFFMIYYDFPKFHPIICMKKIKENHLAQKPLSYPQNKLQHKGPSLYYSPESWLFTSPPVFSSIWTRGPSSSTFRSIEWTEQGLASELWWGSGWRQQGRGQLALPWPSVAHACLKPGRL